MESLYRKYRPQTFADVVGQQHVVATLERAVTEGRTTHAYLFCGPRGTGKTTMARLLAKALLCDSGPGVLPDGTCEQCALIAAGEHPDVYELDAASRTGVDNVREEIVASVAFAPVRGRAKIYIIDEVHMLTTAAFNALLKTLEEPPGHVVFVLCTTDPQKVPETILSRVQRFDFHAIVADDIVARLAHVAECEHIDVEADALALIARHARGGMRDALGSLEQLAVFGDGAVTVADAESMLGAASTSTLAAVVAALAARDVPTLFAQVAMLADAGRDLLQFTRELAGRLRDAYVVAAVGARAGLTTSTDDLASVTAEAAAFGDADRIARALSVLADSALAMRTAPNQRLVLEIAFTRIARPEADLTLDAVAERVAALEAQLAVLARGGVPSAGTVVASASPSAAGSVSAPAPLATQAPATPSGPSAPVRNGAASAAGVAGHPGGPRLPDDDGFARPVASASGLNAGVWEQSRSVDASGDVPAVAMGEQKGEQDGAQPSLAGKSEASTRAEGVVVGSDAAEPSLAGDSEAGVDVALVSPAPAPGVRAPTSAQLADQTSNPTQEQGRPAQTSAPASLSEGELQRRWRRVVDELIAEAPARGSLLASATLESDDGEALHVTLPKGSTFASKMLVRQDVQATIAPVVERVFGHRRIVYAESSLVGADIARNARAAAPADAAVPAPQPSPVAAPTPPPAPASPVDASPVATVPLPAARQPEQPPAPDPSPYPMPWEAPADDAPPYDDVDLALYDDVAADDMPASAMADAVASAPVSTAPAVVVPAEPPVAVEPPPAPARSEPPASVASSGQLERDDGVTPASAPAQVAGLNDEQQAVLQMLTGVFGEGVTVKGS